MPMPVGEMDARIAVVQAAKDARSLLHDILLWELENGSFLGRAETREYDNIDLVKDQAMRIIEGLL